MLSVLRLRYYENETLQIVDFPYGSDKFTATILLPRKNGDETFKDAPKLGTTWRGTLFLNCLWCLKGAQTRTATTLDEVVAKTNGVVWSGLIEKMQTAKGILSFPKFKCIHSLFFACE